MTTHHNRRMEGLVVSLFHPHRRMGVMAVSLAALIGALPGSVSAKQRDHTTTRQHARDAKQAKPVVRPRPATACADYGPGFAPVEGTGTCIKIGGSIGVGTGGTVR